jgi:endonuclease YncB( thermonuclease family)
MKFKTLLNASVLFIGLGLVAFQFIDAPQSTQSVEPPAEQQKFERWQVKEGSIYDGDTLRVVRGQEELKIRFCGIDAPEKNQELGIEARDHLRSLVEMGNGELLLVPVEQDRYQRTVAEVYIQDKKNSAIPLNLQMVRDGYAWHYQQYSDNCPSGRELAIAQEMAQKENLGIWQGNPQPPWEWRKANK